MNDTDAIAALGALAQEHRLGLYRLLMHAGPSGMSAGDLADRAGLSRSGLSFHIAQLERAGLVHARRQHRNIFYAVEIDAMRRLLTFLTQDCCNGNPDICGELAATAALCGTTPETER
ncbi:metalloregulator ArsR/SmtB family transcription factor [Nisaea acidiphila]|uniref:Metalloregulator ArsR/SmtB family transcription factor n=1 Tax=Nisaea acidiphila TaxID=1862145 RepID=A0A9J7B018_9PROT|nr:metalloregulator ArsR/SmtB family transcription factor [Nisaea acidiphila]UUX52009.1 metalloregulator ArsR/SmtB family transcription factor [Nisaea acidiphila]